MCYDWRYFNENINIRLVMIKFFDDLYNKGQNMISYSYQKHHFG